MGDPLQSFWALVNHRLCLNNGNTDISAKASKAGKKSWPYKIDGEKLVGHNS